MKIIDAEATRAALDFARLIPALQRLFVDGCDVPPRHTHVVTAPNGDVNIVLVMPAWQAGGCLGIKTVSIAPGNAKRGLPGLHSTYLLSDAMTGVPLALIDGDEITTRRTAAASALAASKLARADASRLLVVGTGRVAALLAEAYRTVLPIRHVSVWGRNAEQAAALVARLDANGIEASVAADLEAACASADVVSCATLATEPVVRGAWLRAGTHLDLIGSFTPSMREADDDAFAGASIFVDTDEALHKSGELLGPISRGVFRAEDVAGTLGDLCRGLKAGRRSASERTVFKSVGTALADLAAAMLVHETVEAREAKRG